ncbi:H-NS family nucleoid-associated regulatory protein [Paraburkholderia bryophila]|uniref:DNA-binding protein H-NS n=1 Tax=Paraburkholderia bryophila TaxID=420952 RepID=A0A329CHK2_9BURK|nr:H-NS family nucleoid-associated regulatory protein [Paraburkholderia bryophila]RAS33151.1 DNA-binding protein H-NS [Paraburkholderia bryophila]
MATLESLQARIKKLEQQAESLISKQASGVIEKIHELMAKHGLTTADIDAHAGGKKRGPKPGAKAAAKSSASAAKYRDPKTGSTWTGHGRAPAWIVSAKDRSKFLVEANAVSSAPAAKKSATAGNYVRGPQPALYLDPKSGATWSGRGRAPAWIANAKNRSRFLIGGAGAAADAKPMVTKAVAKKAPAAKKTAANRAVRAKVPANGTAAKKAPRKSVAVPTPVATVEPNVELTT